MSGFAQVEAAFGRYAFTTPTDPEVAWKMGVIPVWSALEEMQASKRIVSALFERHTCAMIFFSNIADTTCTGKLTRFSLSLEEMQASGAHGDAMRKARESFQRLTADARAADGSVTFAPGTYRLVVAKPC